jgi:hypothetical protein
VRVFSLYITIRQKFDLNESHLKCTVRMNKGVAQAWTEVKIHRNISEKFRSRQPRQVL